MGVVSDPADPTEATVETIAPPGRSSDLAAGTSLGKYHLERVLGMGGVGVVWAAHDPDLERTVALKVLRNGGASSELRTRLLREARAMARLKHPNVLTVYEAGSQGDRDFIAMELVEGDSLDAWLMTEPPRDQIWQAILAAGRGLAAAHRAGLIHRDFKPQNVLRGTDGRVLVTDFGLARTHSGDTPRSHPDIEVVLPRPDGDTLATDATLDAPPSLSALDQPLTQTGALLGTPAYMAPEQYLGAGADPRTDQFAFCVTAWQLLAGRRPFEGNTLEELRKAMTGGAMNARGDLPRRIRRVLARGLASDPARRWPDMNTLLAALERSRAWPRRLLAVATVGVVATGIALGLTLVRRDSTKSEAALSTCDISAETEMARAWSPALRTAIAQRFAGTRDAARLLGMFDSWAAQWIDELHKTCSSAGSTAPHAKLGCLMSERDVVGNLAEVVPSAPRDAFYGTDLGGILPRIEACSGDAPMTLPAMPKEPATQARIRELRPKVLAARFGPPEKLLSDLPKLIAQVEKLGWAPLTAEAHMAYGVAARRARTDWEGAHEHFKIASRIARGAQHYHLETDTTIGLLDSENDVASDPASDAEFRDLLAQARIAADNAGRDPSFLARIALLEGTLAESREDADGAIAKFEAARTIALAAGHHASALVYATTAADAMLRRDRPDDLDRAWALLADTERAVATVDLPVENLVHLWERMSVYAMLRGDIANAHAYGERYGPKRPSDDNAITTSGRVVDAAGRPVAGATVVTWRGLLMADSTRVYIGTGFEGAIVTSDRSGSFTLRAPRGGGIIAELADRRSRPRPLASTEPLVLVLEPTRAIAGIVASGDTSATGLRLYAGVELEGGSEWRVGTAVTRAGTYRLAGIPSGTDIRLDSLADPNQPLRKLSFGPPRDGAKLRWPAGVTLDVIVRGVPGDPMILVFRGRRTPRTHAELEKLFENEPFVVRHPAYVVGIVDQTVEGMKEYRRGDHHARFLGIEPGPVTACIHGVKRVDVLCKTIDVPKLPPHHILNGHGIYPVMPVLLEPAANR